MIDVGNRAIASLTPREKFLMVETTTSGDSLRDLAKRLHLAPQTIKNHLKRIHDKLGTESRLDLLKFAVRNNVIESPRCPCKRCKAIKLG